MNPEEFLSIKEFAILIRVHPNTVRRHIHNGRIAAFRLHNKGRGAYRIPRSEINKLCFDQLEHIINELIDKKDKRNCID